jgi:hypothetical protein
MSGLTPDAVDARILASKNRKDRLTPEEYVAEQTEAIRHNVQARSHDPHNVTLTLGPEPPKPPPVTIITPNRPRMNREDVKLPQEAGFILPMIAARFVAAWRKYVDGLNLDAMPAEGWPQPSAQDYATWREQDFLDSQKPSDLAQLVTQADSATVRENSQWHSAPVSRGESAGRQRGSTFGDGMNRPGAGR